MGFTQQGGPASQRSAFTQGIDYHRSLMAADIHGTLKKHVAIDNDEQVFTEITLPKNIRPGLVVIDAAKIRYGGQMIWGNVFQKFARFQVGLDFRVGHGLLSKNH
jgi:hypothetical protein